MDPVEEAKEWKRNLAKESRKLDRDILHLERAEKKAMKECKIYAKKVFCFIRCSGSICNILPGRIECC